MGSFEYILGLNQWGLGPFLVDAQSRGRVKSFWTRDSSNTGLDLWQGQHFQRGPHGVGPEQKQGLKKGDVSRGPTQGQGS